MGMCCVFEIEYVESFVVFSKCFPYVRYLSNNELFQIPNQPFSIVSWLGYRDHLGNWPRATPVPIWTIPFTIHLASLAAHLARQYGVPNLAASFSAPAMPASEPASSTSLFDLRNHMRAPPVSAVRVTPVRYGVGSTANTVFTVPVTSASGGGGSSSSSSSSSSRSRSPRRVMNVALIPRTPVHLIIAHCGEPEPEPLPLSEVNLSGRFLLPH